MNSLKQVNSVSLSSSDKVERWSNIEVLRIIAMLMILILHADFFSLGLPSHEECQSAPVSSFMRLLIEALCLVSVNSYILISGYFGIKWKKRSLFRLLFLILFWRLLVVGGFCIIGKFDFLKDPGYSLLLLIPGYQDWFIGCYLLLMLFSPILNSFISSISTTKLLYYTLALVCIEVVVPMISQEIFPEFAGGYSVISFMIMYLCGATIRRLKDRNTNPIQLWALFYLGISWLSTTIFFNYTLFKDIPSEWLKEEFLSYTGITVLPASICFFMIFVIMRFKSRFVNHVAASSLAIYVFHMHPLMQSYFKKACRLLFNDYSTWGYIGLISLFLLGIFVTVVLIDQLRIYLWERISKSIP